MYTASTAGEQERDLNWSTIISELVSIRKAFIKLQEDFQQHSKVSSDVQALIKELRQQAEKKRALQAKEDRLLSFLIEEFNVKE